jgi:hypothetical protein
MPQTALASSRTLGRVKKSAALLLAIEEPGALQGKKNHYHMAVIPSYLGGMHAPKQQRTVNS